MQGKPFVSTFNCDAGSFTLSLGLTSIPTPATPISGLVLSAYFMTQVGKPVFKSVFLKKSGRFIFLNTHGKYELLDLESEKDESGELPGEPTTEQLQNAFFITKN